MRSVTLGALTILAVVQISAAPLRDEPAPDLVPSFDSLTVSVPLGLVALRRLTLNNTGDAAVIIRGIDGLPDHATGTLSRRGKDAIGLPSLTPLAFSVEPERAARLEIRVDTSGLEFEDSNFEIRVLGDDPEAPLAVIPVTIHPLEPDRDEDADEDEEESQEERRQRRRARRNATAQGDDPRLSVEPHIQDLGIRAKGEELSTTFVLKNEGKGNLLIERVRGTCTCTVGELELPDGSKVENAQLIQRLLEPGEEAKLTLQLDTSRMKKDARTQVFVFTNDERQNPMPLGVVVELRDPFVRNPNLAYFGEIYRSDEPEISLQLSSPEFGDFDITGFEAAPTVPLDIDFRKLRRNNLEHPTYEITFKIRPDAVPGMRRGLVRFAVEHPRIKAYELAYSANILPDVQFLTDGNSARPTINFNVIIPPDTNTTRKLVIQNHNPDRPYAPTRITIEATPDAEPFKHTLTTIEEGMRYEIELRIEGKPKLKYLRGKVIIESDYPGLEKHVIPFQGYYRG